MSYLSIFQLGKVLTNKFLYHWSLNTKTITSESVENRSTQITIVRLTVPQLLFKKCIDIDVTMYGHRTKVERTGARLIFARALAVAETAHLHLLQQLADSTIDCVNTDIGIFLSLSGNATVYCPLQCQMQLV